MIEDRSLHAYHFCSLGVTEVRSLSCTLFLVAKGDRGKVLLKPGDERSRNAQIGGGGYGEGERGRKRESESGYGEGEWEKEREKERESAEEAPVV